jgi:hypothetical protein
VKGHEILWSDDGGIGYRCYNDPPGHDTGTVFAVDEGDKVFECNTCKERLKASWRVSITPTTEPVTVDQWSALSDD